MTLAGRVALVTGGAKGLGPAIVEALAGAGADLALIGRDMAALAALRARPALSGRRLEVAQGDVTDDAQVAAAVGDLAGRLGRVDILVNAAGGTGGIAAAGWQMDVADFDALIEANLKSAFLVMRAAVPRMIAVGGGRIVNIAGTYGLRGREGRSAYSAAKWGLRGLTKSFARELGAHNITVNAVCPGLVEGPALDAAIAARGADAIAAEHPLRRVATAVDVAEAVLFLVGESGRSITGQDVVVDCGWSA
ncbi:MAG TPA: SDR family NAD(P)-dependent oxidoreductase [Alphaproteobacteria bacterium]